MVKISKIILAILVALSISLVSCNNDLTHLKQGWRDSLITAKIATQFAENQLLNPLKLSISTNNGRVRLSGHVKNRKAFVTALRLAKSTKGVKTVNIDNLMIKEVNSALADAYITAKIETVILKAKVFEDESIPLVGIKATTVNGVVTLSGLVKKQESIKTLVKFTKNIRGVKQVNSSLKVRKDE